MTFLYECLGFAMVLALLVVALWQNNDFLYLLTTSVAVVYGLRLADGHDVYSAMWVIGLAFAIMGMFCLFRVVAGGLIPMIRSMMRRGK